MNNKLIISDFFYNILLGYELSEDKLVRIHNFNENSVLGNIYCGYVRDIAKNINAAFIDFDKDKKGFLSLKECDYNIQQGDKILVQVAGDKIKSKDYILTTKLNLNSDNLVLVAGSNDISISKKISDVQKRNQLKQWMEAYKNSDFGFIIRTNSINSSEEELHRQADELIKKYNKIKLSFQYSTAKSTIIKNNVMIDICNEFINKKEGIVVTDNHKVFEELKTNNIDIVLDNANAISLSNKYRLEKHLRTAINKNVWLKSGAYLVIENTEALTVIDVNTGKADCRTNRDDTLRKINLEAAKEIMHQIQIRNLSGIIIVDFINMKSKDAYNDIQNLMNDYAKYDFSPCYIVGFTKLGLMEISRKKIEKPLHEILMKYNI